MYGEDPDAEVALALRLLPRIPPHSLLMADRNFGVFGFAYYAVQAGHDVLTRLTAPRFRALQKKAQPLGPGRWTLTWTPTATSGGGRSKPISARGRRPSAATRSAASRSRWS